MKPIQILSFVALFILSGLSFTFCYHRSGEKHNNDAKGFAVVELFTSEGCSSCPPADEVMIKLAKELSGDVYFLGYHVDYWDYIGWKDAFANAEYTERQTRYAEIFKLNSIYTPQAIVNGKKEMVGSKESQLRDAIQQALKDSAQSAIELTASKTVEGIHVAYKVTHAGKSDLLIALVQLKAITNVKRGENSGHKLEHLNIVRDMRTIAVNKEAASSVEFTIPSGLTTKDVKLIAFVQDKSRLGITGATTTVIKE